MNLIESDRIIITSIVMYISLEWLKDYINIPDSIDPLYLKEKLTTSTAEVEGYTTIGQDNIFVGKVVSIEKHPNADKLKLATVTLGKEERKVVCGGTNLKVEMLVAFAKEGTKVKWHGEGEYVTLEKATIRGEESNGMICASNEIDLPISCGEMEIADLTKHVKESDIGKNVYDVLGIRDVILEVDNKSLTHRPDLFGHYGFAREVYAVFKNQDSKKLKLLPYPQKKLVYGKESLTIEIKSKNCRRYSALKVSGVKVAPSPLWLRQRLQKVGVRPINNIVDITNFVMYDLGQPLHAFDGRAIEGNKIIIRQAKKGEKIVALDTKTYELQESDLVIADDQKPVAIAGIMGGEHFSVSPDTTVIIFESANFDPTSIRKTSQRLGLRSESSTRFEKNLDPEYTILALNRAVALLQEVCPSAKIASRLFDDYPVRIPIRAVSLQMERVVRKIGLKIPSAAMKTILKDLGCSVTEKTTKDLLVTPPSWRATKDILSEDDLIEEIARIYGYDKIPHTVPYGPLHAALNSEKILERRIRNIMVYRLGFFEITNYPFTNLQTQEKFHLETTGLLQMKNILSSKQTHLKTNLIPDLLENAKENIHQFDDFSLFEFGRIYKNEKEPAEKKMLSGILVTKKDSDQDNVFYILKTKLETLFHLLNIPARTYEKLDLPFLKTEESASINSGKTAIGYLGVPKKEYGEEFDLSHHQTAVFVLDQQTLQQICGFEVTYVPTPKYPPVIRDFAVVVDKDVSASRVEEAIRLSDPFISSVELFDTYEGEKIGPDKRSLAYSVMYLSPDKTLTEQDIEQITQHILKSLEKIGATLRG